MKKFRMKIYDEFGKPVFDFKENDLKSLKKKTKIIMEKFS
jgi:hypothetical protein